DVRAFRFRPIRIEQGVIFIPIAVRPAVDGDRLNVFRRGKPASAKDTRELVSRPAFEIFKRGHQELHAPGFVLFAGWKPRLAGPLSARPAIPDKGTESSCSNKPERSSLPGL